MAAMMPEGKAMTPQQPQTGATHDQPTKIIPFPRPHRGDPNPRRFALASIGFQYQQSVWRRGRVALTDDAIDQMDEWTWAQCLRRWTRRRPKR
jgi:hypothetical protein